MKFKKGDLVEIIYVHQHKNKSLLGKRFVLNESSKYYNPLKNDYEFGWFLPFTTKEGNIIACSEDKLKKINPDGDELSDLTFEELMRKLKTNNLETIKL